MRIIRNALLIGASSAAVIGLAAMAQAKPPVVHELHITLPGGTMETIRYTGDVAPKVSVLPGSMAPAAFMPMSIASDPLFAQMDRISAMMDRQASLMIRQAEMLSAIPDANQPFEATFSGLPAGSEAYSFVSTMSGNNVCMRSIRVTYQGNKRNVQSSSSGHCPTGSGAALKLPNLQAPALQQTGTIEAKAASPMHEVAFR